LVSLDIVGNNPGLLTRKQYVALGIAIATVLAAIGVGVMVVIPRRPSRAYTRPLMPPGEGAFRDGGVPLRDGAIEQVLSKDLSELVLACDRDRQVEGGKDKCKSRASELASSAAFAARGPELFGAWRELVDTLDRWAEVPIGLIEVKPFSNELTERVRAVSDRFASLGLGYYIDGDLFSQSSVLHAVIYAYRVEEVVFVYAANQPRRVLSLRRLDDLNLPRRLMGMQARELGDPVIILDQIDEHVSARVLPVIADDAWYPLGDEEWRDGEGRPLALAVAAAIRSELLGHLGTDAGAASKVATLMRERTTIVDQWRQILEDRGLGLQHTDELFLPARLFTNLDGVVPSQGLDRVRAIEDEMAGLEAPRIASRCQQLVMASVRRHEAQHGLDDERAHPLRYPIALETYLGGATALDGEPREMVERARAELSAYVSQIVNDPITPQLTLWSLASFTFDGGQRRVAESYVGLVILETLAHHLAIPIPGELVHDGQIDRARLAQIATPITQATGDQLRAAARATWAELYGVPFVEILDQ
jgi:hypothetical protein